MLVGELERADVGPFRIGERLNKGEMAGPLAVCLPPPEGRALKGQTECWVDVVWGECRDERAIGPVDLRHDSAGSQDRSGSGQRVPGQVAE